MTILLVKVDLLWSKVFSSYYTCTFWKTPCKLLRTDNFGEAVVLKIDTKLCIVLNIGLTIADQWVKKMVKTFNFCSFLCYSAELPLRVGLIHTVYIYMISIHEFTHSVWALPLTEVLRYSASNAVMRSKYASEYIVIFNNCHMYFFLLLTIFAPQVLGPAMLLCLLIN